MRVQTTIGDTAATSPTALPLKIANDLDYLASRIHACRSRMAEAERLDGLCRIPNLQEFFHTIFSDSELQGSVAFQRLLVRELTNEISGFLAYVTGLGADLLYWMLVRFKVENLKVLIRACLTKTPFETCERHLIPLPRELALDAQGLAEAESPKDFARLLPKGMFREGLEKVLAINDDNPKPFFLEAALDQTYFQGLIDKTMGLPNGDREIIIPMVYQEADTFHLMLVARGRFHYRMTVDELKPFHVAGTRIPRALFAAMLGDQELNAAAGRVTERVLDEVTIQHGSCEGHKAGEIQTLEGLAWRRFFRLANLAFRQSHMGLGAIMGYVGLRRMEVANLITISEGIRSGIAPETIRARLIPLAHAEVIHV